MKKVINLKKNISIALVVRILAMLVGFVSSIFITRYLGPELKGKMSYFLTLSATIWMVLDLGFHKSLPYILAKNPSKLNSIFSFSTLLHLADILLLLSIFAIFKEYFLLKLGVNSISYLLLFIVFTAITRFGFIIKFIMLGVDRIFWQNMLKLLPVISYIALFLIVKIFITIKDRYFYVLAVLIFATIFWTYFYTIKLFVQEKIKFDFKFDITDIYQTYKLGIKAFLSGFFIFMLIRFDIFLIEKYDTLAQLGIYALAANFVTLLQSFSNLVGSLMLPKFVGSDKNDDNNIITLRRVALIFSILVIVVTIIFFIFGKIVISTVYGIEFIKVFDVFALLLPAVLFLSLGSLINTYFWSKGFPIITILLPIVALIVNISLNVIFIPRIGIIGAAIATTISYAIWFSLLITYFFKSKLVDNPKLIIWNRSDFKLLYNETIMKFRRR